MIAGGVVLAPSPQQASGSHGSGREVAGNVIGIALLLLLGSLLVFVVRRTLDAETANNVRFLGRIVLLALGSLVLAALLLMAHR